MATQVLDPILSYGETNTAWYEGIPWYKQESNVYYYMRNGLTSVADIILQTYNIIFMIRLQKRLKLMKNGSINRRIFFLCILIEIFLIIYLLLSWL